jgi:light-regulated signal transduction histidine kinase (bacteriophytochrome)
VSHDLRAPLRAIDRFSQALLDDHAGQLDEGGKKHLRRVRQSVGEMGQLIDGLLTLSRVTRAELKLTSVDLSELVRRIASRFQAADPTRQVEFVIQEGLTQTGDATLLPVLLENLLGNAWKFTSKREHARIEFGRTEREEKGKSEYFVRDNGAGFDMAYADKLFGAFQRLHSTSEFEGTGIGLATVERVVRRHGGTIRAEGAVDRGATFYFTLDAGIRGA